jgi:transposase
MVLIDAHSVVSWQKSADSGESAMPNKIYIVELTDDERSYLLAFIKSGVQSARKLNRARILLLADEGKTDGEIAAALHTGVATVQRTRQRFVEGNIDGALNEKRRPGREKALDEKGVAVLETLAHSQPPAGRKRWTLELLADRLVELKVVDSISYETVRRELKKNGFRLT